MKFDVSSAVSQSGKLEEMRPRSGERVLWCKTCGRMELALPNIVVSNCPNCRQPMATKPFTFTR